MDVTKIPSDELLSSLDRVWLAGNRALSQMLAFLGEVERRGLYVEMACSSMFAFLERRFGLTGGSAYRRLVAARLARVYPSVLGYVERGEIHLDALCALKPVLTPENAQQVLERAAKKTLREVEQLVASLAPKPDVRGSIRKLPERTLSNVPISVSDEPPGPARVPASSFALGTENAPSTAPAVVAGVPENVPATPSTPPSLRARPRFEQLSEDRHKVQLTVSSETRAKLERARALMKHRNPTGSLEVVFDSAIEALLERLEKERLANTPRPRENPRPSKPGHVPAEVRREVFARDGEQCTFRSAEGMRCDATELLELDHVVPRARRGADAASNLRVVCRAHNRRHAEDLFGRDFVTAKIEASRREPRKRPSREARRPTGPHRAQFVDAASAQRP